LEESSAPLAEEATVSINSASMGASSGNLGEVSYQSDRQKRVFLLPQDLSEEVSMGEILELPIQSTEFGTTVVNVPPLDSPKIMSARVYDTGLCSSITAWDKFGTDIIRGIFTGIRDLRFNTPGGRTVNYFTGVARQASTLQPIFREVNITRDADTLKIRLPFTAARFSGPNPLNNGTASCTNLRIVLEFEIGLRRVAGRYSLPPRCLASEAGANNAVAGAYDFLGVLRGPVNVSVTRPPGGGSCDAGLTIRAEPGPNETSVPLELAASLTTALPDAFLSAIRDSLLQPASLFGLEPKPCTCDIECVPTSSGVLGEWPNPYGNGSGQRHRCILSSGLGRRTCGVQLEADRLAFRPDGFEVVLAEDESDTQFATVLRNPSVVLPQIRALCEVGRSFDEDRVDFVAPGERIGRTPSPFVTVP